MSSELDDTLKKVQMHKGVIGLIVINGEGVPIRSTLDTNVTVQYAALITHLCDKARSAVRDLDPNNDLTFLRLRSRKQEILVAPEKSYVLIVIQVQDVPKVKTEEEAQAEEEALF
ncbi:dynein light chain roadblock-type 2-like [Cimex lectularius]|uniref:Dynein light chain roadblock n=1 Tax=Cimex lectularius TaxID=79782 RepID=A0A8I6RGW0_CIMLE|nr:dynein light chain roadblock-type 2-like [Cimex lectularius]